MKTFSKFIPVVLLALFLSSCGSSDWNESGSGAASNAKHVKIQTIDQKPFSENLKLIGKVASSSESDVSPLVSGLVKTINVKVGDPVKAGDILATLDTKSNLAGVNLNKAQSTYENSLKVFASTKEYQQSNLEAVKLEYENAIKTRDNTYASTQKDLELAQSNLESVQLDKWNTQKTNATNTLIAEQALEASKTEYEGFKKSSAEKLKALETNKKSVYSNIQVAIDNSIAKFDAALSSVDELLGISELRRHWNDEFETYLSAKNAALKAEAEVLFSKANTSYKKLTSTYSQDISDKEITKYYSEILILNNDIVALLNKTTLVLDNSITSSSFSESTLSSHKATIRGYQDSIISLKSSLVGYNNSLNDLTDSINATKVSIDTQTVSYEQGIKLKELSLENTKASGDGSLGSLGSNENKLKIQIESTIAAIKTSRDASDNAVSTAKARYSAALASYNSSLSSSKSELDTASLNVLSSSQEFENSYIRAGFDGVVTEKYIEVGNIISAGSRAFKLTGKDDKILKIGVSAENIRSLKIGKEAIIKKDDTAFTWSISILGPTPDSVTGMFTVEVSINNTDFKKNLTIGSYVDVYVEKSISEENYIIVPFSALLVGASDDYSVFVVRSDGKVMKKSVIIGKSNSKEVIVTSGLQKWDKIVVEWVLNLSVWDTVVDSGEF